SALRRLRCCLGSRERDKRSTDRRMKVVLTGGVTGGHIYPALAVAEALRDIHPDVEILFIGGRNGMESKVVPTAGIKFVGVTTGRIRKILSPSTLPAAAAMLRGYGQAKEILSEFRPDVAFSTGGY